MRKSDRLKLHFGPYRAPRFKLDEIVPDELRGDVKIVGISDARIPWPLGAKKGKKRSPVLYGTLVKAVQRESVIAVAYWFGTSTWKVMQWRKALTVASNNDGTLRLRKEYGKEPFFIRAQHKAWSKATDPLRCEKIAAAKRGKSRPKHVMKALRQANLGRKLSSETRRKMSKAHQRRGTRPPWLNPPWESWEDALLITAPAAVVAKQTGRTQSAVFCRRRVLGLPDGRSKSVRNSKRRISLTNIPK